MCAPGERPRARPKEEVELQDPAGEPEAQPPPEAPPSETPVPEGPVEAPDEQPGRGLRIVGLVAGGLGVAMAGTGVYFALLITGVGSRTRHTSVDVPPMS